LQDIEFLGAFAKLRKTTVSFVRQSLCPSHRMEQLGFHWIKVAEEIETHILCSMTFSSKIVTFMR